MTLKVEISGLKNEAQAEQFVNWYACQGEQFIADWLECRKQEGEVDISGLNTNSPGTFPLKWEGDTLKMIVMPSGQ